MPSLDDEIKVGAREAQKKMAAEAIRNIKKTGTLVVEKLTMDDPYDAEIVTGLKTLDDVFNHYLPNSDVEFEDEEGNQITENIKFKKLDDLTSRGFSRQSKFLMRQELEQDFLGDFIRQLKSNKTLRKILEDPETREAFLSALDTWINEIPE